MNKDNINSIENKILIFLLVNIFPQVKKSFSSSVALGHSSINVSLTYLRGLEIAELKEEDMPMV